MSVWQHVNWFSRSIPEIHRAWCRDNKQTRNNTTTALQVCQVSLNASICKRFISIVYLEKNICFVWMYVMISSFSLAICFLCFAIVLEEKRFMMAIAYISFSLQFIDLLKGKRNANGSVLLLLRFAATWCTSQTLCLWSDNHAEYLYAGNIC